MTFFTELSANTCTALLPRAEAIQQFKKNRINFGSYEHTGNTKRT